MLRFYQEKGLIARSAGGASNMCFHPIVLERLALVAMAAPLPFARRDRDLGAHLLKQFSRCQSDPAAAACNDCSFSFENSQ